ncbi:glycosyltransferase family 4 protein [Actinotalea sp. Marseille-Q4924]|uniref:glycosyltransferase family 4 protein n=1 Tax=Actinotalea sp. Marseille-Q4924 TaxID=2866571 RepID=UPI001CE487D9|nr:glycosyltransferase family 4 protein [Actinotalea sp. Marseille-Q4924]
MRDRGGPVRVLQLLGSSAGGVARHVAQVASGGADRGWRVLVAGPASLGDRLVPAGSSATFAPVEITDRPGRGDATSVRRIAALSRRADVVHAHGLRAGALAVLAVRGSRHGARRRPAVVVTLHNLPVGGRGIRAVAAVLEQVVCRGADVVLGVSGDLVARSRHAGARRAERALVPAPPQPVARPAAVTRAALGVPDDAALLVTVARLAPQKGLDLLADAAAALTDAGVLWLVAGDGPLQDELERRVAADRLPVRVLGRRDDVADLMAAADVVVSTARWEGQPLNVQEALALGAAVVATDVGGTREVTEDAAVLVAPDAGALADAVRHLLADPAARSDLSRRARERAAQLPDLAGTLDQLARVYGAALGAVGDRYGSDDDGVASARPGDGPVG